MMIPTAEIICTQDYDSLGNPEPIACRWEGPENGIMQVSHQLMTDAIDGLIRWKGDLEIGTSVQFGPYRLKIINWDAWTDSFYLVRQDNFFGRQKGIIYRLTHWLKVIYQRLILTAAIWKLVKR